MKTKNLPKLSLTDLLRRRKMSLKQFIDEFGITTFEMLCIRCDRMGVSAPEEDMFRKVIGPQVSSPTEGVLILEPLEGVNRPVEVEEQHVEVVPKQRKKKRTENVE